MAFGELLERLQGGDRRSVRGVAEAVALVEAEPALFAVLVDGLADEDAVVRMRCADAIEKLTVSHPEYLAPYGDRILALAAGAREKELRWHFAQLLPRLPLGPDERRRALEIIDVYLGDESSSIVRTFAMQALVDLGGDDPGLRDSILERIRELTENGTPAMRARGRKLLARLAARHP